MMRFDAVVALGAEAGLPVITIESLIAWRQRLDRVERLATTRIPTVHGTFTAHGYRDTLTGDEHVALVSPRGLQALGRSGPVLTRLHSECLTGDAFGSLRCDCGPQLQSALSRVGREGGVVVYLGGHEGRGVGLVDKLRAYSEQDAGADTVDAQTALGLPVDARDYAAGAAILHDLGAEQVVLLTNNPTKVAALRHFGVDVVAVERLHGPVGEDNARLPHHQARAAGPRHPGRHRPAPEQGDGMKDGAPTIATDGTGLRVAVVAASWHEQVMGGLLDGALRGLADAGVTDVEVVRVPGTFELPVACAALADRFDALVALGVVIRGGTPHFDYVCQAATVGITEVAVRTRDADRLRRAHVRRRGPGARPGRAARLRRGQGPRGGHGRGGHRRRAATPSSTGSGRSRAAERHEVSGIRTASRPHVGWGTVKSFEQLYAELAEKAATRPEGSGTVAQLDAGVHAIGKKIVEEAAEVWMAAEYESNAEAAEEISQLLYHLQVLMLAKGISLDDVYAHL